MLQRLLRPSAFKVALLVGLGFAGLHLASRIAGSGARRKSGLLDRLEAKALDWKFQTRGELPHSHRVALAEIDERAVQAHGLWPWNRGLTAACIDKLAQAGASVIALDMIFSDPDRNSAYQTLAEMKTQLGQGEVDLEPRAQQALAHAPNSLRAELAPLLESALREHARLTESEHYLASLVKRSPDLALRDVIARWSDRLVLGTIELDRQAAQQIPPERIQAWSRGIRAALVPVASEEIGPGRYRPLPAQPFPRMQNDEAMQAWLPSLVGEGLFYGAFSTSADADGTMRRYDPLRLLKDGFFPALGVAAVARASGFGPIPVRSPLDSKGLASVAVTWMGKEAVLPVDVFENSAMLINFVGNNDAWHSPEDRGADGKPQCQGASCDRVSMADVLAGTFDPAVVKDKIVFVGVTAIGTFDQRVTPFNSFGPGVFVHMNVAEDLVSGRFIQHGGELALVEAAGMLLLAVLFGLLLPRVGMAGQLAVLPLGLGGTLSANLFAFSHGVHLATVTPMLEIVALVFGVVFFQYFSTDKEKRQVRQAFQYYLTESVMTEMLADPSKLKLGGVKKELTVMFSDIRGFTTLSEMLEASEVAKTLNEYLTPMTNLVFQTGGTLDKYMGDAIMAFWGAPLDQKDHALKACQTACAMIERLDVMRAEWKAKGRPDIDIGIGLNSGNIHVGNMGSDIRFDYTVIGDDVNLASRLEGTNKSYGTRVILGENTYRMVQGEVVARELGGVVVKGKKKPVTIFELRRMGSPNPDEARAILAFERGLAAYRRRAWDEAELSFGEVLTLWPHDGPSEKYLDDVAEKRSHPPDAGWDGVYVMKTK